MDLPLKPSKAWRRISALVIVIGGVLVGLIWALNGCTKNSSHQGAFASDFLEIQTSTPVLSTDAQLQIQRYGEFLLKDHNIQFITVILDSLSTPTIGEEANKIFQTKKIGGKTGQARGLLLLIALKEQQVRFEVGYDLESIFPDSFIGYIETRQMQPFFELGRVGIGIEATVEMIVNRSSGKLKDEELPSSSVINGEAPLSGGAGADHQLPIGIKSAPDLPKSDPTISSKFKPSDAPGETFNLYLETCRLGIKDMTLDIFSDGDREFFKNWPITDAQLQNYLRDYEGQSYKVEIQGDLAVILFPAHKRKLMPIFEKRERGGWTLDFATCFRAIKYSQHPYWFVKDFNNEYMFALNKYYVFDKLGYPHPKKGTPKDW